MNDTPTVSHDDVTRWFDGAAQGIAHLLPDNDDGIRARGLAERLAAMGHRSLDAAGVPREGSE